MASWVRFRNTAQVEIIYRLHHRPLENRIWVGNMDGPYTLSSLVAVGGLVGTWIIGNLLPLLSDDLELVEVRSTDWNVPLGVVGSVFYTGYRGGQTGEAMPANVTASLAFRPSFILPRRRWCLKVPGVPRDVVVENELLLWWRNAVINAFLTLRPYMLSHRREWLLGSRVIDGHLRPEMFPDYPGDVFFATTFVGPQRRRLHNV